MENNNPKRRRVLPWSSGAKNGSGNVGGSGSPRGRARLAFTGEIVLLRVAEDPQITDVCKRLTSYPALGFDIGA